MRGQSCAYPSFHNGEVFVYFKHEDEPRGPAFARDFLPMLDS